ncbi:MAG: hypothetical protein ACXVBJ_14745 [Flavisolibacter sp.]
MKDIKSISAELWKLIVRTFYLLLRLSRQIILPTRRRRGNVLNTLFLFYIGLIENIQHFEHRRFKLAEVIQNKVVRTGLMVFAFLLFLLTSFEQPIASVSPVDKLSNIQCSYQKASKELTHHCPIKVVTIKVKLLSIPTAHDEYCGCLAPALIPPRLYLENRSLLI